MAIPTLKAEITWSSGTNRQCQDDRSNGGVEHVPFCQPGDAPSLVPTARLLTERKEMSAKVSLIFQII